jgi:hypothetical protein
MLIKAFSDQFGFVKKCPLMPRNAIFKSKFITETEATKIAITRAFLYLLVIGASAVLAASANSIIASADNMPEANTVASAEMKASAPIETKVGELHNVAESNRVASQQLEPIMLFLLGTMLLSIGAAIRFARGRHP